jgi:hypothetical protein
LRGLSCQDLVKQELWPRPSHTLGYSPITWLFNAGVTWLKNTTLGTVERLAVVESIQSR